MIPTAELPCSPARLLGYYDLQGDRIPDPSAQLCARSLTNVRLSGDRVFVAELGCTDRDAALRN